MAKLQSIFSLILILLTYTLSYGQEEDMYAPAKEKVHVQLKGIRFGVNVGRFTDFQFKPERFSYEGSFDVNLNNKYFVIFEGGYSEINLKKDNYTYISNGTFMKIGIDNNMLKKHPTDYLGIGFRIGKADFKHSANSVLIENNHWPSENLSINSKYYDAYWLEIAVGIKGELLKNVYFGWSALVKIGISGREDSQFQPYNIPGFGKASSNIHLGANYYIYYQIPFNRKK